MKRALAFLGILSGIGTAQADPADRVILAAMRVGEMKNYSWTASVMDDARSYTIEGKTQKGGYTWARLPMVASLAQRLGRDADTDVEAIFKGASDSVIRTDQGWRRPRELPKHLREWHDHYVILPVTRSHRPLWGVEDGNLEDPWETTPILVAPPPRYAEDEERRPYSNAQYGISHPHEELAVIVSSYTTLNISGDCATGTLTDLGAQLLLVREGQDHISPLCAAGMFKLYLKNGMVVRYQLRLEGILLVERKKVHVHQASNTTISNVGVTQFSVPDEARHRLEQ